MVVFQDVGGRMRLTREVEFPVPAFVSLRLTLCARKKWIFLSFLSPCDGAASSPRRRVSHDGALSPRDEGVRSPDESGERKTEPRPREA